MNSTDQLLDDLRELEIQTAGKRMEILSLMLLEPGCDHFDLSGERAFCRMQMETLIAKRSPAQIGEKNG